MSYIPDCRTDENYNIEHLNDDDKSFVQGFDWCVEMAVDNFFDNEMHDLLNEDSFIGHILSMELPDLMKTTYDLPLTYVTKDTSEDEKVRTLQINTYADLIRARILEWIEMERDELITSMVDNAACVDSDEIEKIMKEDK